MFGGVKWSKVKFEEKLLREGTMNLSEYVCRERSGDVEGSGNVEEKW